MSSTTCANCGAPLLEEDRKASSCRFCRASFQRPEEELSLVDVVQLAATSRALMEVTLRDGCKRRIDVDPKTRDVTMTERDASGSWKVVARGSSEAIASAVEGMYVVEAITLSR